MESAGTFLRVLAASSLWLTGSGLVLWLWLRRRPRISPFTRAGASVLVVLQGWIWFGIAVELPIAWLPKQEAVIRSPEGAPIDVAPAPAAQPLHSQPGSGAELPVRLESPADSASHSAARAMPDVLPLAAAAVYAIWLAGMVILVGRSTRGFAELSGLVHSLPPASVEWQNELTALCDVQSPGKAPVLKIGAVATPMLVQTWGAACIVVPAWLWESCTAGQRTSILLHELAHYRRGDVWRQLALRLLVLPHWFNPVAWWAAGQFAAASEDACDDAAAGGDDPQAAISYCKALLIISERVGLRPAPALAISGSSLTERVRRVLHPEFQKESPMSRFLILTTMIVLTGLATIRIQAAAQSPPAKSEAAKNEADKNEAAERKSAKDEAAKTSDQSLLANGGFERSRDDSNDPVSWFATRWPKTPGHYLMAASSSVAHGGKRSVFVEIGDSHPDDQRVHYNWTTVAQHWQPGETYELSGWIKTEDVKKTAFIMVQFWDEEGKDGKIIGGATTQYSSPVTGTTDWTRASTRLKVAEGTGAVRIRAGLSSEGNRGAKAWFDDISLAKVAD